MSYSMMQALKAPGLTAGERVVYCYLVGRANGAKVCWPSVSQIAADLELTPRTVMSATGALSSAGRIKVVRRYKETNHYFVLGMDGIYDGAKPIPKVPEPVAGDVGHMAWSEPSDSADPTLKKTAVENVWPEENDTQEPVLGEKNDSYDDEPEEIDNLDRYWPAQANVRVAVCPEKIDRPDPGFGCNFRDSGVKKTAQESEVQERVREEGVQASKQALLRSFARELAGPSLASLMAMTGKPAEYCAGVLITLLKGGTRSVDQVARAVRRAEAKRPNNPVGFLMTIVDDPADDPPPKPRFNALGNQISCISGGW